MVWIVESEKDCSFEEYIREANLDVPEGGLDWCYNWGAWAL